MTSASKPYSGLPELPRMIAASVYKNYTNTVLSVRLFSVCRTLICPVKYDLITQTDHSLIRKRRQFLPLSSDNGNCLFDFTKRIPKLLINGIGSRLPQES